MYMVMQAPSVAHIWGSLLHAFYILFGFDSFSNPSKQPLGVILIIFNRKLSLIVSLFSAVEFSTSFLIFFMSKFFIKARNNHEKRRRLSMIFLSCRIFTSIFAFFYWFFWWDNLCLIILRFWRRTFRETFCRLNV